MDMADIEHTDENSLDQESAQEQIQTQQESSSSPEEEYKWWILKVKAGREDFVKKEIEKLIEKDERLKEVFVPEEEEEKSKKKTKEEEGKIGKKKKMLPGYVYVRMKLDQEVWNEIKAIPGVGYILGERGVPFSVPSDKIESLKVKSVSGEISKIFSISVGDRIRIKGGPFKGLSGVVEYISDDRTKARVLISIFGRQTPLVIETAHIEKEA